VLVVDDSKPMRMMIIRTLRQSGVEIAEIREAEDGAAGLAAVADWAPDLVLSDWNMPNMTGIQFLTALRDSDNSTTFGFVTSESGSAVRERALAAGASFLLVKPFDGERFAEVIGATVG
jgi:two-component system chemotaxis response regulator CheY